MKKRQILLIIVLMFITVLTFYPVLSAGFINLDDRVMVTGNWKIQSLSPANLKILLFESHFKLYHPLVNLSYAVEYHFFGADPYFYHANNLIIHLLNTLLVFFIFFRLTGKNFIIAYVAAFIFACHPLHVEPAAWVSGRKDTLYAFFFLGSWLMYLKSHSQQGRKYALTTAASLFLFLFACLSKSMAVTLPAVLILCDWLSGRKFDKKAFFKYLPYAVTAVIFSLSTYALYYTADQKSDLTLYTLFINFAAAHFNVLFYIVKFLIPVKLSAIYPYFYDMNAIPPDYILYSPALLYGIIVLILYSLKKTKVIFFGFAFFIVTILPVINILPTGISFVADRYAYIPLIGFAYIIAAGFAYLYGIMKKKYMRAVLAAVISAVFILMSFTAHTKAEKWLNTKTLFDDIIKNYPADIAYAHSYAVRGDWFRENEMNKEAEKDLNLALFFDEDANLAKFSLAGIMMEKGKYDEALKLYASLPQGDINIAKAYAYSANIYYEHKHDAETAHEIVEKALKLFPNNFSLHIMQGSFYNFEEKFDKAEESFQRAKKIYQDNRQSYLNLAGAYEKSGRDDLAIKEYVECIRKCGEDSFVYNKLGRLYFKSGYYDAAEKIFGHVTKIYPDNYEAYDYLGRIYAMKEDYKKASYYFTLSILTNKNYALPYFHRATIHFITENYLKAEQDAIMAKKLGGRIPEDFKDEMREKSGIIL